VVLVYAEPTDFEPVAPVRCTTCGSADVFPLPVMSFVDRVAWATYRAPFKCRQCHATLYRRVLKLEEWEEVTD
jgi:hypothetical protein